MYKIASLVVRNKISTMSRKRDQIYPYDRNQRRRINYDEASQAFIEALQTVEGAEYADEEQLFAESQALAEYIQSSEIDSLSESMQVAEYIHQSDNIESIALAEALQVANNAEYEESLQAEEESQAFAEALQAAEEMESKEIESKETENKLECNICFDDIEDDGKGCPAENCFAVFHEKCIDRWVAEGRLSCAMCQVEI